MHNNQQEQAAVAEVLQQSQQSQGASVEDKVVLTPEELAAMLRGAEEAGRADAVNTRVTQRAQEVVDKAIAVGALVPAMPGAAPAPQEQAPAPQVPSEQGYWDRVEPYAIKALEGLGVVTGVALVGYGAYALYGWYGGSASSAPEAEHELRVVA